MISKAILLALAQPSPFAHPVPALEQSTQTVFQCRFGQFGVSYFTSPDPGEIKVFSVDRRGNRQQLLWSTRVVPAPDLARVSGRCDNYRQRATVMFWFAGAKGPKREFGYIRLVVSEQARVHGGESVQVSEDEFWRGWQQ